jgi:hypothetical protein
MSGPLAQLLDDVRAAVTRYVVVGVHEATAIALWIAHAWALDAFDATGYLEIRSPVRRCGKTTLLSVLDVLVPRPWTAIEPSEAVFYRRIAATQPTLLLDEVDAIFNKKSEATEGLRACLNAGNRRGTTVPRCQPPRMDIVEFEVFCAKALAGIGGLPATITDRSIPIEMRRKQPADRVARFRSRQARDLTAPLVVELEQWAAGAIDELARALADVEHLVDEDGPLVSLDDRAFEQAWEPLLAGRVPRRRPVAWAGDPGRRRAIRRPRRRARRRRQPAPRHPSRVRRLRRAGVVVDGRAADRTSPDRGEPVAGVVVGSAQRRRADLEGGSEEARPHAEAVRHPAGRRVDAERRLAQGLPARRLPRRLGALPRRR